MIDRGSFREIDWVLIGLLVLNSIIGVVFIFSSSHYLPGSYALKQAIFIVVGLALLFLLLAVDYKVLMTYSLYFYLGVMVVLAGLLLFAKLIAHTKSWIRLPFFQVQPSELAKIALILLLARIFSEYKKAPSAQASASRPSSSSLAPSSSSPCSPTSERP